MNKYSIELLQDITDTNHAPLRETFSDLIKRGWSVEVLELAQGRCYYQTKRITVPIWAVAKGKVYASWYLAHEMTHAVVGAQAAHGPAFMDMLQYICPPEAVHFELTYKPQNALAAGIMPDDF